MVVVADMVAMTDVGAGVEEGAADDVAVVDVDNLPPPLYIFFIYVLFTYLHVATYMSILYLFVRSCSHECQGSTY